MSQPSISLNPFDAAWLAGFIDGEGYIGLVKHLPIHASKSRKPPTQDWYSSRLSITNTDRPVLEHIRQLIGRGTISTTSKSRTWKPMSNYVSSGRPLIRQILLQVYTFSHV